MRNGGAYRSRHISARTVISKSSTAVNKTSEDSILHFMEYKNTKWKEIISSVPMKHTKHSSIVVITVYGVRLVEYVHGVARSPAGLI